MPNLFPLVASSPRALRHVEMGARIPDHQTSANHSAIEPDRGQAGDAGSDPVGCYVTPNRGNRPHDRQGEYGAAPNAMTLYSPCRSSNPTRGRGMNATCVH